MMWFKVFVFGFVLIGLHARSHTSEIDFYSHATYSIYVNLIQIIPEVRDSTGLDLVSVIVLPIDNFLNFVKFTKETANIIVKQISEQRTISRSPKKRFKSAVSLAKCNLWCFLRRVF